MIDGSPICLTLALERCVAILANLWHAPNSSLSNSYGSASIGSSEAIMLAGLAMKKRWEARRRSEGKSIEKPNLVMGANVQVCWEKLVSIHSPHSCYLPLRNRNIRHFAAGHGDDLTLWSAILLQAVQEVPLLGSRVVAQADRDTTVMRSFDICLVFAHSHGILAWTWPDSQYLHVFPNRKVYWLVVHG